MVLSSPVDGVAVVFVASIVYSRLAFWSNQVCCPVVYVDHS